MEGPWTITVGITSMDAARVVSDSISHIQNQKFKSFCEHQWTRIIMFLLLHHREHERQQTQYSTIQQHAKSLSTCRVDCGRSGLEGMDVWQTRINHIVLPRRNSVCAECARIGAFLSKQSISRKQPRSKRLAISRNHISSPFRLSSSL